MLHELGPLRTDFYTYNSHFFSKQLLSPLNTDPMHMVKVISRRGIPSDCIIIYMCNELLMTVNAYLAEEQRRGCVLIGGMAFFLGVCVQA